MNIFTEFVQQWNAGNVWPWLLQTIRDYLEPYACLSDPLNYLGAVVQKYISLSGYLIGLVFLLMILFSTEEGDGRFLRCVRTLVCIAVINCAHTVTDMIYNLVSGVPSYGSLSPLFTVSNSALTGILVTLILVTDFHKSPRRAFFFGLAVYSAMPLLHAEQISGYAELGIATLRILVSGLMCVVVCKCRYFYTGIAWYAGFHYLLIIISYFSPMVVGAIQAQSIALIQLYWPRLLHYLTDFYVDQGLVCMAFLIGMLFEGEVLPAAHKQTP